MKHRITYVRDNAVPFDPDQIKVEQDSLTVRALQAVKEYRLTIGLSELPAELVHVLEQCHELRLRWATPEPYATISPFNSRVAPGLHAFFTPIKGKEATFLCPTLKEVFGHDLKCSTVKDSFSSPPILSERFTSSTSAQYHQMVPSLAYLVQHIQSKICWPRDTACQEGALSLLTATYLDADYDAISHALIISAYWSTAESATGWADKIQQSKAGERIEVGILNAEKPKEREELSMAGFLAVIGDDDKAKPTMFSFPARHHGLPASSTFQIAFDTPTGLHPTLRLKVDRAAVSSTSPHPSCMLHAYLTLPSHLFLDRHQFSDPLFLASHNLASLRALSGATDLEAPDWAVQQWGSAALFELATPAPDSAAADADFEATIPMHLRYLPPSPSGYANASLPYPAVFWACRAEEGTKMTVNPFDRVGLGYDGLFGERTMFYHLTPAPVTPGLAHERTQANGTWGANGLLEATLTVPVLDTSKAAWVESGTVGVVVLGFAWLVWKLLRPSSGAATTTIRAKKNE